MKPVDPRRPNTVHDGIQFLPHGIEIPVDESCVFGNEAIACTVPAQRLAKRDMDVKCDTVCRGCSLFNLFPSLHGVVTPHRRRRIAGVAGQRTIVALQELRPLLGMMLLS